MFGSFDDTPSNTLIVLYQRSEIMQAFFTQSLLILHK
jgi:hypothetical protein